MNGNDLARFAADPPSPAAAPASQTASTSRRLRGALAAAIVLSVLLFCITEIPYAAGRLECGEEDCLFNGPLMWEADQNMYFSFIRQASDGHLLFGNRLTHLPHHAVLFNSEWLLVGWMMRLCGNSPQWAYGLWRALGVVCLVAGLFALTAALFRESFQRRAARAIFLFGGGFGWLFLLLAWLSGAAPSRLMILDTWTGTHPFAQVMLNPHFSLPHGLFLLFVASFVVAERTGKCRWYWLAAVIVAAEGTARPYDLIALFAILPLYLIADLVSTRTLRWKQVAQRTLPLLLAAPVAAYYFYVFYLHDVFSYWASQGPSRQLPLSAQLVSLGPPVLLLAVRLLLLRRHPLTAAERLLACWAGGVLLLMHANRIPLLSFVPYTHQVGSTLVGPIVFLAVRPLGLARRAIEARWAHAGAAIAWGIVLLCAGTSIYLVPHLAREARSDPRYRIAQERKLAWDWLDGHADESDVVFCEVRDGNLIAKYVSAHVTVGHWSVTPRAEEWDATARRLFSGRMERSEMSEILGRAGATWVYRGSDEGGPAGRLALPEEFVERYRRGGVTIHQRVVPRSGPPAGGEAPD